MQEETDKHKEVTSYMITSLFLVNIGTLVL
jgi:hypothetical protein